MNKWKRALLAVCLIVLVAASAVVGTLNFNVDRQERVAFTIGSLASAVTNADYTADGVDDDVQFQAALNALPATGGKLYVLAGTYVFSATPTRAIANVTIEGVGRATYFTNNGVAALFTAGSNNWVFTNLRTDAGGLSMGATTGWQWNNVTVNATYYAARTPVASTTGSSWEIPTGRTATYVVAASNAPAHVKAQADYVADGVADNVEIQAAVDAIKTTGGEVLLTPGNYALAAGLSFTITQWINPVRIVGYGAILTYSGVGYAISLTGDVTHPYTYFTLEGFSLVGNALATGGLSLYEIVNCRFKNLEISLFTNAASGYGILLADGGGANSSEGNSFSDIILFRNQIGFASAAINSAANTSLSNVMIVLAPANGAYGVKITQSFTRSQFNNVVVQMGRDNIGNGQIAWYFNAYTMGTVLNAVSVDDAGVTPTGGEMIHIDGIKGGLTFVGYQYARAGTNTYFAPQSPDDFPIKFVQAAISGSDITQPGMSNDANAFPDGTFNRGTVDWTASNALLSIDAADKVVGRQSLKLISNGAVGSAYAYVPDYARFKNGWITVSFNYKVPVANNKSQALTISDGTGGNASSPQFTKDGAWHYMEVRKLVNAGAVQLAITAYVNTGAADVDDELRISGLQVNQGMNGNSFQYSSEVNAIYPGEIRTASGSLVAGIANAIFFAWQNPELQDILIRKVVIEITTPGGTALSVGQVGVANDAAGTGLGTEFFPAAGIDLNAAAVRDSWNAADTGAQVKWEFVAKNGTATNAFVVGKILVQNAAALAGEYYIEYVGR